MELIAQIQPKILSQTAVKLACSSITLTFRDKYDYASAMIALIDANNEVIEVRTVAFSETELSGWGSDDTFVVKTAAQKLNITLK